MAEGRKNVNISRQRSFIKAEQNRNKYILRCKESRKIREIMRMEEKMTKVALLK